MVKLAGGSQYMVKLAGGKEIEKNSSTQPIVLIQMQNDCFHINHLMPFDFKFLKSPR